MFPIHALAAVLASFRLNDLFAVDVGPFGVFERIRRAARSRKFKLFECYRCISLTIGGAVCSAQLFAPMFSSRLWWTPLLNYPLALSCLGIVYVAKVMNGSRETKGKEILISLSDSGELKLVRSDVTPEAAKTMLTTLAKHVA